MELQPSSLEEEEEIEMAKLGTIKRPAVVHVRTEARAGEIMAVCESNGWQVIVGIEPDQPEDISDINTLSRRPATAIEPTERFRPVSGNNYCPCGSGKKYKKCCMTNAG
jgi:SWIM/SEC-C metal-binding protein